MSTLSTPPAAEPATGRPVILQIPTPTRAIPPVTARRLRRWIAVYAVAACAAALAAATAAPASLQLLAAGLPTPGGAFFASGHPWLGAGTVGLVGVAIFAWWAFGPAVAPPLVWIGSAAIAALTVEAPPSDGALALSTAAPALLGLLAYAVHRARFAAQRRRGAALNVELAAVPVTISGPPSLARAAAAEESSEEDLAHLRYALDLALQPVDAFDGFLVYDQFREAALRYQCYMLGYALSMARATRTPAFSGYLAEAQRGAIEKVGDRRVWGYWAIENAWGRLRTNRDPVNVPGNIMLTGYHGAQIGMYETFGDDRYSQPGAITYRWSEQEAYANDFTSIAESVQRNMAAEAYTLFPCEPNWIYTVCNAFGLAAIASHDQLHGTTWLRDLEPKVRNAYESEFLRPDGRLIGMRSNHCGLSWNFWTGPAVQLTSAFWLNPSLPEIAQRHWSLLRREITFDGDGRPVLPRMLSTRVDPGNYVLGGDGYANTIMLVSAREFGDEEVAAGAQRALEAGQSIEERGGVRRYEGLSPYTGCAALVGRFGRENALRDLVAHPLPVELREGPVLAEARYPEVLVARATTDGRALDLVLRPGAGPVRTTLVVERLLPGARYAVEGGVAHEVVADGAGRAEVLVELSGRLPVRVAPAG